MASTSGRAAFLALILLTSTLVVPPAAGGDGGNLPEWTMLVFYAADDYHSGQPSGINMLRKMETTGNGSGPNLNALLFIDKNPYYAPDRDGRARLYYVQRGENTSMDIYLGAVNRTWTNETNTGDPETLVSVASYVFAKYPAKKYALILRGSGTWPDMFTFDGSSRNDPIQMYEMRTALSKITKVLGRNVDLLALLGCTSGMMEWAYQLMPFADFFVSSEYYSVGSDWRVHNWMSALHKTPRMSSRNLASFIVDEYTNRTRGGFNPYRPMVGAAIYMAALRPAVEKLDALAYRLRWDLPVHRANITRAVQATGTVGSYRVDAYQFAEKLVLYDPDPQVTALATEFMDLFNRSVVNVQQNIFTYAHGLSIYLPPPSLYQWSLRPPYLGLNFVLETHWMDFIREYFAPSNATGKPFYFRDAYTAISDRDGNGLDDTITFYYDVETGNATPENVTVMVQVYDRDAGNAFAGSSAETFMVTPNVTEYRFLSFSSARASHYDAYLTLLNASNVRQEQRGYYYIWLARLTNVPPSAYLYTRPSTAYVWDPVTLVGNFSTDPDGTVKDYWFDYGNGIESGWLTTPMTTYSYPEPGSFPVRLKVRDNAGAESTWSQISTVVVEPKPPDPPPPVPNQAPQAVFVASPPVLFVGETLALNGSVSHDPDGRIVSYIYEMGDGSPPFWSVSPLLTHIYRAPGRYQVRLAVVDDDGAESGWSAPAAVEVRSRPAAYLFATPTTAVVGGEVVFNGTLSLSPGAEVVRYLFDFGDGNTSGTTTNSTARHSYATVGNFTARVKIWDSLGTESEWSGWEVVTVQEKEVVVEVEPPAAVLNLSAARVAPGVEVVADGRASSNADLFQYDFGDGTAGDWTPATSAGHRYAAPGIYVVRLKVRDISGQESNWAAATVLVQGNEPPVPYLFAGALSAAPGEPVVFNGSASQDPDGRVVSYWYDFGDGFNTSWTARGEVAHAYARPGNYSVSLRVMDNNGSEGRWAAKAVVVVQAAKKKATAAPAAASTLPMALVLVALALGMISIVGLLFIRRPPRREEATPVADSMEPRFHVSTTPVVDSEAPPAPSPPSPDEGGSDWEEVSEDP